MPNSTVYIGDLISQEERRSYISINNNEISSIYVSFAGLCSWLALFISLYSVVQHFHHFHKPYLQKYIIRIIWMIPIYSINAWLALKFSSLTIYFDTLRECYEAFVLYSFMKYLTNYLYREMNIDKENNAIEIKPPVKHLFPFNLIWAPLDGGYSFLYLSRHCILQYIAIRPLTTFIALVSEISGIYYNGTYSLDETYIYLLIINNISQMTALYFLTLFYLSFKEELSSMKPFPKFVCIKFVIFITFFQSCIISFLINKGFIIKDSSLNNKRSTIDTYLQDLLICYEMLIASIAHLWAFSHQPFINLSMENSGRCYSFMRVLDFSDERTDLTDHVHQIYSRLRIFMKNRRRRNNGEHQQVDHDYEVLIPLSTTSSSKYQNSD